MKWWMLRVERRSHKQGGDIHPPSTATFHTPSCVSIPPRSIFQLGIPNCHLRGSQIHIFCFSLLIPLCVFLTSVETNIFHIYEYVYICIYSVHIYINRKRGERVFLDSSRPLLSSTHPFTFLYFFLMLICFILFIQYVYMFCRRVTQAL